MKYLVPFNLNESFDYKKFEVNSNKLFISDLFINEIIPFTDGEKNNKYIIDILKFQDDYSIWNIDGSLNEYRFKDMMIEIKGMKDD